MPIYISLPLSVLSGVGLMNAINMIDGVDGLSSGFGIITSSICAIYFYTHGDIVYAAFASIFIGALVPFFFCNVFSHKFKMYIGDSGALVMGTLAYIFVCRILNEPVLYDLDRYKVSMAIAIFAVPLSDTVRVMCCRMWKKTSPFKADRTHMHHILVDLRFPHIGVTVVELFIATLIFWIGWFLPAILNIDITLQLIITLLSVIFFSCGTYSALSYAKYNKSESFFKYGVYIKKNTRWLVQFRQKVQKIVDQG